MRSESALISALCRRRMTSALIAEAGGAMELLKQDSLLWQTEYMAEIVEAVGAIELFVV